jgi:hypothetical protein
MVTIYALRCLATGEAYVGCTAGKLGKRMREHRCLLNGRKHKARRLQARWDEYGSTGFTLESLESLPTESGVIVKRERELFWMRSYSERGMLLNEHEVSFRPTSEAIAKGVEAARHAVGNRWTPETNLKRRLAQLGTPKGHGAKISATKRARAMR